MSRIESTRKQKRSSLKPRLALGLQQLEPRIMFSADVPGLADAVDPNDQLVEARSLGAVSQSLTVTDAISPGTDVDMYSFSVSSGQAVAFDIDCASGSDLDSYLRIFDSSGREVASNDDGQAPGESFSFESYLEHTFTSGGTYYAGVSGYGNSTYSPTTGNGDESGSQGGYILRLSGTTPVVDTDDQISEAQNLGAMTAARAASGSISPSTDVDMYRFSVSSGQTVAFDIDGASGSDLDSYLRIFDSSGRDVASNDDGQAPGESFSFESYLEHTFTSGGTYYAGVSGYGNSSYSPTSGNGDGSGSQGGYTLRLSGSVAMPTDADDQISEAQNLGAMTATRTANGSISPSTDVDMYRFSVSSGQRVAFDIDRASGSDLDSYLRIFDSSGREVVRNDDGQAPGEPFSYESYLEYTFASGGTYYAGVSGYGNSSYNATTGSGDSSGSQGGYTLRLSATTPIVDSDDQISEAQNLGSLTAPRTANGSINRGTDVDMFAFSVTSGQRVAFDIDGASGSDLDSYLRIFDSSGREVARNDDGQAPGESFSYESYLEHTFTSGGAYYAGVSGYGNSSYSATTGNGDSSGSQGGYILRLSGTTPIVDPDDQISEAQNLGAMTAARTANGSIDRATDVDMYAFSVTSGQRVAFDIDRASGSDLDSYLRIFDSSGREVARNDDAAAPGESFSYESYLEHTFTSGGTYYAGVSGYGNSSYNATTGNGDSSGSQGGYTLRLSGTTPIVDPDDQISEAQNLGAMTAARTANGSIDRATDVDMYRFSVSSGQTVAFDIDRASGSDVDSYLRIFDSSGREVARNDDGQAPGEPFSYESYLEYTFTSGGTYYAGVSGYGNSSYSAATGNGDSNGSQGSYVLRLSGRTPVVDTDDQISEAQNLGTTSAARTANGSIDRATDVDMYRFSVSSGQTVAFDIDRASGSDLDSYLRIFDSSGREVVRNDDGQAPGESFSYESYLEHTFASGGTYYAGVSGYGNSSYNAASGNGDESGSQGGYILRLSGTTPVVDTDDQISEAQNLGAVTTTRTASSSIDRATDVDMYRFSVSSGQTVAFDIDRASSSDLDSYLRIFDSSGREVVRNDDGQAPGEPFSYESYLEYTFTSGGAYYAGVSGYGNSSYDATSGTGDHDGSQGGYTLTVTPLTGVSQIVGTVAQPSRAPTGNSPETINVTLECVDGASSGTIESGRRTWVVAHGRASRSASFTPLAAEIAEYEEGDQVLTLDWSDGAGDNWPSLVGMDGAGWIPGVADWAAGVLHGIGLQTEDLFFVGHSWGTWLSYEMATRVAGGVQGIVALDPAADASFEYDASDVDFGDVAQASWAFHGGGLFGSPTRAATADESFTTTYSASRPIGDLARHSMPVDIFTDLVRESNSARPSERARLFSLDRLVADQAGSWREDVYNSAGSPIGLWRTFEGVFELDYQAGDWQTSLLRYTTPDGATARV